MIPDTDDLSIQWVPLSWINWDEQPINELQVAFYTRLLKAEDGHLAPPILNGNLTVRDGRHRLLAHKRAGRTRARCIIVHHNEPMTFRWD